MKVFMCTRQAGYSGGLAVVAANSVEEAFRTFFEDEDYEWMVDKYDCDTFEYIDDCTKWRSYDYPIEKWFAWSLHRLIELLPQDIHLDDYADTHYYLTINPFKVIYVNCHLSWIYQRDEGCLYDKLVDTIEWTIKHNFFNKEYLKQ